MRILTANDNDTELRELVSICRSDSGITGTELRRAHRILGRKVGNLILEDHGPEEKYAVVALMRAGMPFAEGIADALMCPILFLDEKHDIRWTDEQNNEFVKENREFLEDSILILADAVINTGETILRVYNILKEAAEKVVMATNVVQREFYPGNRELYCARASDNRFKGCRIEKQDGQMGPDTGDRLFDTL